MSPEGSLDDGSQIDSLDQVSSDCAKLRDENARLREKLKSNELDMAILKAEYENQVKLKGYLKAELESMEADLNYVERQFVSLERSIQADETRASAVAAVAEVQILREKLQRENPELLDSLTVEEVNTRLAKSDDMIKERNYAAAVYHATRAMRILNLTERRIYTHDDGATRIVTVSGANLRGGPGSEFDVLEQLKFGTVVVELKSDKNWYQIRTKKGKTGWIHASLVR
jgi:hypothetical protein